MNPEDVSKYKQFAASPEGKSLQERFSAVRVSLLPLAAASKNNSELLLTGVSPQTLTKAFCDLEAIARLLGTGDTENAARLALLQHNGTLHEVLIPAFAWLDRWTMRCSRTGASAGTMLLANLHIQLQGVLEHLLLRCTSLDGTQPLLHQYVRFALAFVRADVLSCLALRLDTLRKRAESSRTMIGPSQMGELRSCIGDLERDVKLARAIWDTGDENAPALRQARDAAFAASNAVQHICATVMTLTEWLSRLQAEFRRSRDSLRSMGVRDTAHESEYRLPAIRSLFRKAANGLMTLLADIARGSVGSRPEVEVAHGRVLCTAWADPHPQLLPVLLHPAVQYLLGWAAVGLPTPAGLKGSYWDGTFGDVTVPLLRGCRERDAATPGYQAKLENMRELLRALEAAAESWSAALRCGAPQPPRCRSTDAVQPPPLSPAAQAAPASADGASTSATTAGGPGPTAAASAAASATAHALPYRTAHMYRMLLGLFEEFRRLLDVPPAPDEHTLRLLVSEAHFGLEAGLLALAECLVRLPPAAAARRLPAAWRTAVKQLTYVSIPVRHIVNKAVYVVVGQLLATTGHLRAPPVRPPGEQQGQEGGGAGGGGGGGGGGAGCGAAAAAGGGGSLSGGDGASGSSGSGGSGEGTTAGPSGNEAGGGGSLSGGSGASGSGGGGGGSGGSSGGSGGSGGGTTAGPSGGGARAGLSSMPQAVPPPPGAGPSTAPPTSTSIPTPPPGPSYTLSCALAAGLLPSLECELRHMLMSARDVTGLVPQARAIDTALRRHGCWPAMLAHGDPRQVASLVLTLGKAARLASFQMDVEAQGHVAGGAGGSGGRPPGDLRALVRQQLTALMEQLGPQVMGLGADKEQQEQQQGQEGGGREQQQPQGPGQEGGGQEQEQPQGPGQEGQGQEEQQGASAPQEVAPLQQRLRGLELNRALRGEVMGEEGATSTAAATAAGGSGSSSKHAFWASGPLGSGPSWEQVVSHGGCPAPGNPQQQQLQRMAALAAVHWLPSLLLYPYAFGTPGAAEPPWGERLQPVPLTSMVPHGEHRVVWAWLRLVARQALPSTFPPPPPRLRKPGPGSARGPPTWGELLVRDLHGVSQVAAVVKAAVGVEATDGGGGGGGEEQAALRAAAGEVLPAALDVLEVLLVVEMGEVANCLGINGRARRAWERERAAVAAGLLRGAHRWAGQGQEQVLHAGWGPGLPWDEAVRGLMLRQGRVRLVEWIDVVAQIVDGRADTVLVGKEEALSNAIWGEVRGRLCGELPQLPGPCVDVGFARCATRICCSVAGASEAGLQLLLCGRCRAVGYCSVECQKADWAAGHKAECGAGAAGAERRG